MHRIEYNNLRQKIYFHISENDANFVNLKNHNKSCLLKLDNYNTYQVNLIAKYARLMFQRT